MFKSKIYSKEKFVIGEIDGTKEIYPVIWITEKDNIPLFFTKDELKLAAMRAKKFFNIKKKLKGNKRKL